MQNMGKKVLEPLCVTVIESLARKLLWTLVQNSQETWGGLGASSRRGVNVEVCYEQMKHDHGILVTGVIGLIMCM